MRKLIFAMNLTLDGCCDHTKGMGDEEMHNYHTALLRDGDTFVYGRKTYELMVPFWPDMAKNNSGTTKDMNDFAQVFDSVKKIVVFSRTLEKVDYKKAVIVRSGLGEEILKLKQQEGKNILTGGVDIPSQLIALGLVDEFHFVVQPLLVGKGIRMLENYSIHDKLKLVDSRIFNSGCVALRYVKS